jgi:hypothetical protein
VKEYQTKHVPIADVAATATQEAQGDWQVLSVVPHRMLPALGNSGLELTEVLIVFERGN